MKNDRRRGPRVPIHDRRLGFTSGLPQARTPPRDDGVPISQDKRLKSASKASSSGQSEPEKLYGIAELADEFGITARAIRFYEAKQLLTPPRVNGGRVYTKRERARMTLILRAKSIGFSLAEIKQYLDLYGDRGEGRPLQADFLAERSATLIAELEQKQANIAATLRELKDVRKECLRFLNESGAPLACVEAASRTSNKTRKQSK
jgi:DNA-binding transcriptional MerR regulator